MSIVSIRDINIAYEDTGQGTPLVLIHGHPFNRSMWSDQVCALSTNYRVIAPDLRGYGETTVVPGKTTLEDFARDVAQLLDSLNIDKITLAGLSMGGQIVFEFYHLFPQRVHALILADTFAQADTEEGRCKRYDTAERLLSQGMREYAQEVLPKMIAPKTIQEQPDVATHVLAMMQNTNPKGAAAALRGRAERRDYTPMLPEITVPVLIIVGGEDEFTPVSDAEFMLRGIRNSHSRDN